MKEIKIDVVVVTYNRIEKLKYALSCYEKQAEHINTLIVVNNHSSDGTYDFLKNWREQACGCKKIVLNLESNAGGAGGFAAGQEYALDDNADWIFVADDDAYIDEGYFESFKNYIGENNEKLCAICSSVYNMDKTIAYEHRAFVKLSMWNFNIYHSTSADYSQKAFYIDLFSYVGTFLNANAMKKYGICDKRLFIYADDSEHSIRLSQYGKIVCIPSLRIYHDSGEKSDKQNYLMSWRDYYSARNRALMIKKISKMAALHFSLYLLRSSFGKKNFRCVRLILTAIVDAWIGRRGIHSIYKPGYIIS